MLTGRFQEYQENYRLSGHGQIKFGCVHVHVFTSLLMNIQYDYNEMERK